MGSADKGESVSDTEGSGGSGAQVGEETLGGIEAGEESGRPAGVSDEEWKDANLLRARASLMREERRTIESERTHRASIERKKRTTAPGATTLEIHNRRADWSEGKMNEAEEALTALREEAGGDPQAVRRMQLAKLLDSLYIAGTVGKLTAKGRVELPALVNSYQAALQMEARLGGLTLPKLEDVVKGEGEKPSEDYELLDRLLKSKELSPALRARILEGLAAENET